MARVTQPDPAREPVPAAPIIEDVWALVHTGVDLAVVVPDQAREGLVLFGPLIVQPAVDLRGSLNLLIRSQIVVGPGDGARKIRLRIIAQDIGAHRVDPARWYDIAREGFTGPIRPRGGRIINTDQGAPAIEGLRII